MFLLLGAAGGARLARPVARRPHPRRARQPAGRPDARAGRRRVRGRRRRPTGARAGGTTSPPRRPSPTRSPRRPPSGPGVWARRADHPDAFVGHARLGAGDVGARARPRRRATPRSPSRSPRWSTAAERFDDAPVPIDLGPGARLAITGSTARAVVRSLIVQLATWTGPADWRLARRRRRAGGLGLVPLAPARRGAGRDVDGRRGRRHRRARRLLRTARRRRRRPPRPRRDRPSRPARPAHRRRAPLPRRRLRPPRSSSRCRPTTPCRRSAAARWRSDRSASPMAAGDARSPARPGRVHVAGVTAATAAAGRPATRRTPRPRGPAPRRSSSWPPR